MSSKSLQPALLNIREMCYQISNMSLCKIESGKTYSLTEFKQTQLEQLKQVSKRLGEFRDLVKEVASSACRSALFEANFSPDNHMSESETPLVPGIPPLLPLLHYINIIHSTILFVCLDSGAPGTASSFFLQSNYNIDIYGQAPDKMSYTDQAQKRKICQRLTWYNLSFTIAIGFFF